jgi:hypothetical protein
MGLAVLVQIEAEHSLVEEQVGLLENVSFLDVEPLRRADLPLSFPIVLRCPFAGFLQS